jgi:hypothetical protein
VLKAVHDSSSQEPSKGYVRIENPARSGDKVPVCWFTKSFEDFYFEDYRSPRGQIAIMELAVADYPDLKHAATNPKNQWERNVAIYLSPLLPPPPQHTHTHTHPHTHTFVFHFATFVFQFFFVFCRASPTRHA